MPEAVSNPSSPKPVVSRVDINQEFLDNLSRLDNAAEFDIRECLPKSISYRLSSANLVHKLSQAATTSGTDFGKLNEELKIAYGKIFGADTNELIDKTTKFFDKAQKRHLVWLGDKSGDRNDVKEWKTVSLLTDNLARPGCQVMQDLVVNGIAAIKALEEVFKLQVRKDTPFSPQKILDQNLGAFLKELREDGGFKEPYSALGSLQIIYKSVAESLQLIYEPKKFGMVTSTQKGATDNDVQLSDIEDRVSTLATKLFWDQSVATLNHYDQMPGFDRDSPIVNRVLMTTLRCLKEPDFDFKNLPASSDVCHITRWPEAIKTSVSLQNTVQTFLFSKVPNDNGFLGYLADDGWMISSPLRGEDNGARNDLYKYINWKIRHTELYTDGVIYEQARLTGITDVVRFQLMTIFGENLSVDTVKKEMAKDWKDMNQVFQEMFFPEILHFKLTDPTSIYFNELNKLVRPELVGVNLSAEERKNLIERLAIPLKPEAPDNLKELNRSLLSLQIGDRRFHSGVELAKFLIDGSDKVEGESALKGIFSAKSNHRKLQEDQLLKAATLDVYCEGAVAQGQFVGFKQRLATAQKSHTKTADLNEATRNLILKIVEDFGTLPNANSMGLVALANDPMEKLVLKEKIDAMFQTQETGIKVNNFGMALAYLLEQTRNKQYDLAAELKCIIDGHRQDDKCQVIASLMHGACVVPKEGIVKDPNDKPNPGSKFSLRNEIGTNLFMFNMSNFTFVHSPYPLRLNETIFRFIYKNIQEQPDGLQIMKDVIQIFKNYDQTNGGMQEAHSVLVALPYVLNRLKGTDGLAKFNLAERLDLIQGVVFGIGEDSKLFEPVKTAMKALGKDLPDDALVRSSKSVEYDHNPFVEVYDIMNARQSIDLPAFISIISGSDLQAGLANYQDRLDKLIYLAGEDEKPKRESIASDADSSLDSSGTQNVAAEETKWFKKRIELVEGRWLLDETAAEAKIFKACLDSNVTIDAYKEEVEKGPFNNYPFLLALEMPALQPGDLAKLAYDASLFGDNHADKGKNLASLNKFFADSLTQVASTVREKHIANAEKANLELAGAEATDNNENVKVIEVDQELLHAEIAQKKKELRLKYQSYFYHVLYTNMEIYNHFTYRRDQPGLTSNPRVRADDSRLHDEFYRLVVGARGMSYDKAVSSSLANWSAKIHSSSWSHKAEMIHFDPEKSAITTYMAKTLAEEETEQENTKLDQESLKIPANSSHLTKVLLAGLLANPDLSNDEKVELTKQYLGGLN